MMNPTLPPDAGEHVQPFGFRSDSIHFGDERYAHLF